MPKPLDLTGQRYGMLVVLELDCDRTGKRYWKCRCDCGNIVSVCSGNLRAGNTKSCGCYKRDLISLSHKKTNPHEIHDGYATIYTFKGTHFDVDLEDLDRVLKICWSNDGHGYFYGYYSGTRKSVWAHRYIMGVTDSSICVDHIDRDKTNCRKSNLRLCTSAQNNMNMPMLKTNTSGHPGISWDRFNNAWRVYIHQNNKYIALGRYKTYEEALARRQAAEKEYFGEFAPKY